MNYMEQVAKMFEVERWHPQMGDIYYYICAYDDICFARWGNTLRDKELFVLGNVFKTPAEAKKFRTEYVDFLENMEMSTKWEE